MRLYVLRGGHLRWKGPPSKVSNFAFPFFCSKVAAHSFPPWGITFCSKVAAHLCSYLLLFSIISYWDPRRGISDKHYEDQGCINTEGSVCRTLRKPIIDYPTDLKYLKKYFSIKTTRPSKASHVETVTVQGSKRYWLGSKIGGEAYMDGRYPGPEEGGGSERTLGREDCKG